MIIVRVKHLVATTLLFPVDQRNTSTVQYFVQYFVTMERQCKCMVAHNDGRVVFLIMKQEIVQYLQNRITIRIELLIKDARSASKFVMSFSCLSNDERSCLSNDDVQTAETGGLLKPLKQRVHHSLEGCRRVTVTERHHSELIKTARVNKCSVLSVHVLD